MKHEAREPADQRAVEANVLKVPSDVELDHVDQLAHIPSFHLISDEGRYLALVFGDELARSRHATPIDLGPHFGIARELGADLPQELREATLKRDRKSTRLNSSHMSISYAV